MSAIVYINTFMIRQVATDDTWWTQRRLDDLRALTPLIYAHMTPCGTFNLTGMSGSHWRLLSTTKAV
jgi:hypothetical protein